MTKTEQKIRELVPSLQELTFGCEIKGENEIEPCKILGKHGNFFVVTDEKDGVFHTASYGENAGFEILGHPIQLHHVLQAIPDNKLELRLSKPYLLICNMYRAESVHWDLTKNYHNQSEEVQMFISHLLE